jgi:hypothetical protein
MADTVRCSSCGKQWTADELNPFYDYWSRVEPGGIVPLGDCPDPDCGAFCYPLYGAVHDLKERLVVCEDVLSRLLAWERLMGGFEASVWDDARRLLGRPTSDDPEEMCDG